MTRPAKVTPRAVREFLRAAGDGKVFGDDKGRVWVRTRRYESGHTRSAVTNKRLASAAVVGLATENGWVTDEYALTLAGETELTRLEEA